MKLFKRKGFTLVEIMIVVAIIGILLAIAVPSFMRARETARAKACQENLQKIDSAKEQWALERNLPNEFDVGDTATWFADPTIVGPEGYIKKAPVCPAGGEYTANPIGTDPVCSYEDTSKDNYPDNPAFWHVISP